MVIKPFNMFKQRQTSATVTDIPMYYCRLISKVFHIYFHFYPFLHIIPPIWHGSMVVHLRWMRIEYKWLCDGSKTRVSSNLERTGTIHVKVGLQMSPAWHRDGSQILDEIIRSFSIRLHLLQGNLTWSQEFQELGCLVRFSEAPVVRDPAGSLHMVQHITWQAECWTAWWTEPDCGRTVCPDCCRDCSDSEQDLDPCDLFGI